MAWVHLAELMVNLNLHQAGLALHLLMSVLGWCYGLAEEVAGESAELQKGEDWCVRTGGGDSGL